MLKIKNNLTVHCNNVRYLRYYNATHFTLNMSIILRSNQDMLIVNKEDIKSKNLRLQVLEKQQEKRHEIDNSC